MRRGDGGHRVAFIALTDACRQVAGHDVGIGERREGRNGETRVSKGCSLDAVRMKGKGQMIRARGVFRASSTRRRLEVEEPNETTRIKAINRRPQGTSAALCS